MSLSEGHFAELPSGGPLNSTQIAVLYPTLRLNLVRAEPFLASFAIAHRIAESAGVAAGLPDFGVHDNGGFQPDDILALLGHRAPPEFLDVALEFGAQRAVIPKSVDPTVDFRRLENEPAPFAQRNDFFHQRVFFR